MKNRSGILFESGGIPGNSPHTVEKPRKKALPLPPKANRPPPPPAKVSQTTFQSACWLCLTNTRHSICELPSPRFCAAMGCLDPATDERGGREVCPRHAEQWDNVGQGPVGPPFKWKITAQEVDAGLWPADHRGPPIGRK